LSSGETEELLSGARRFIDAQASKLTAAAAGGAAAARREVWPAVAELGWAHLLSAEEATLTLGNTAAVSGLFKLIGQSLLPDYLLDAVAVCPVLVAACGPDAEAAVGSLRDGSRYIASAFSARNDSGAVATDPFFGATLDGEVVSGEKILVRDGVSADGFIVGGRRAAGSPALLFVAAGAHGVTVEDQRSIDTTAAPARVRFRNASAVVLAEGRTAESAAALVANVARLGVVSEIVGVATAVTSMTVEYAGIRSQFGRAIASYQAIKHMLADLWRETYQADCMREEIAARIASDAYSAETEMACTQAKAWCGLFVRRGVESALQIHGGIGFTAEGPLARHYLRALTLVNAEGCPRDLFRSIGWRTLEAARQ
jgi:alkylation response protein AidB-like acyl-CoA dehydrogenase